MLLHLLFPDYPDGHGDDGENAQKMPAAEQSQVANAEQTLNNYTHLMPKEDNMLIKKLNEALKSTQFVPNLYLLSTKPLYVVYK